MTVITVNVLVVWKQQYQKQHPYLVHSDFFSSFRDTALHEPRSESLSSMERPAVIPNFSLSRSAWDTHKVARYPKTLVGFISSDTMNDCSYRKRHRELMSIWNDTRVCTLFEFEAKSPEERESCQLIYTFIIGANRDPNGPTEIIDDSTQLLVKKPIETKHEDINWPDTTLLNIR